MISVVVPTFNRPDGLLAAVRSLFSQTYAANGFQIVIVDNTPLATASDAIARLTGECPTCIDMIALHEPAPGVANARNTAMSIVETDLIAFLDDDQTAPSNWLENLLANYKKFPAAVTFGPVQSALPDGQRRHKAYFEQFFAREPELSSGFIEESFGSGNALVDFSQINGGAPWFDTDMNEIGGEDDLLFARARRSNGKFAWAANAPVWEHPLPERVTLAYTLRRAFSYGQAPITFARRGLRPRIDLIGLWMMVGAGKAAFHGLQWIGLSLIRHPGRAFQLDRAVRGIGKVFWWIDMKFYGAAALKASTSKPASSTAQAHAVEPV
ncbi:MAG: glycosyltransferase family 2 protein [Pseudomonadota bacterium]